MHSYLDIIFFIQSELRLTAANLKRTITLLFIFIFGVNLFSQTYNIDIYNGQTINTCSGTFYDSGGPLSIYGNNEEDTVTFCSDNGNAIQFDFSSFFVISGDTLIVFDGPDATYPLLEKFSGTTALPPFTVYSSGTCLTFVFKSNASTTRTGWVASILCNACPPPVISPIIPSDAEVCEGSIINYSVNNHSESVYDWTVFNGTPSSIAGGSYNQDITWDYAGGNSGYIKVIETNSCGSKDSSELFVDILSLPVVDFSGLNSDYCIDAASVTLTGLPAGGLFTGPGISGTSFNPAIAGAGIHNIVYTYTDISSGCSNQKIYATNVHDKTPVSFSGLNTEYDFSDSPSVLIGNQLGGVFSGPGISDITFTPSIAGIGLHTITYTYSDLYCTNSTTNTTTVSDYNFKSGAKLLTNINNWCSADAQFTTFSATPDEIRGTCWNNGPNFNRWFRFQATTEEITISLKTGGDEGTLQYPFIALFDASNNQIACGSYTSQYGDLTIGSNSLVPGNWYYISTDNSNNNSYRGSFTLCVTSTSDYDFRGSAYEITDINNWCSAEGGFSTINASPDGNRGSCWGTGPSYNRWFKFMATTSDILVKMKTGGTEGSLRNGYMALWDEAGNEMACARYTSEYSDITVSSASLVIGNWYYISVDNLNNPVYRGTFTICIDDAVDYDFKVGAIELTDINNWCSSDAQYTTVSASPDENKGSCWNSGPNYNRWFKFQATTTDILVQLKTGGSEGSLRNGYIALWDGLTNNEIACARYLYEYHDVSISSTELIVGNWYYISVDNLNNTAYQGTFSLCVNDEVDYNFRAGAVELTDLNNWCSTDAAYSTINASPDENKGSCWNSGPNYNRWFRFQATTTDILIQLKTGGSEGSLRNGYIALWDELTNNEIACARYLYEYHDISISSTELVPGNWYYISVDNLNNTAYQGTFSLCIKDEVDYDFKAGAIELTDFNNWCSSDAAYSTVNASGDENRGSCWNSGPNYNRWFKFQATATDILVQVKTGGSQGTMRNSYIALFDEMNNELACARYSYEYQDLTISSTSLTVGEWYYISVDNLNNSAYQGSFSLCITDIVDYDFKVAAIELTDLSAWCSENAAYSTMNATPDENAGSCWNSGPNYNRWFKFRATTNEVLVRMLTGGTEGTLRYGYVALWDEAGTQLACTRYTYDYQDLVVSSETITPGQWYYVSVDNNNNTSYRGSFSLCINDAVDYDFRDGSITIANYDNYCSSLQEFTTIGASPDEQRGTCWNSGPNYNRWFRFQATGSDVTVRVKTGGTEGTLRYPYLALWDDLNNQVACATYTSDYNDIELTATTMIPGNWYWVSVDNSNNIAYPVHLPYAWMML